MPSPTLFPILADGAAPRVERLEWLTDVQIARNGTEHRRALRALPRWSQSGQLVLLDSYRGGQLDALAPLLAGSAVLAPAWMHQWSPAVYAPKVRDSVSADALVRRAVSGYNGEQQFFMVPGTGALVVETHKIGSADRLLRHPSTGLPSFNSLLYGYCMPALEMRCIDGINAEARSPGVRVLSLTLTATQPLDEAIEAWTDVAPDGLPNAPARLVNWRDAVKDATAHSANSFNEGHLWSWSMRYAKRTVSATVSLYSRTDILAFRRWLYALKGRATAFHWQCPLDDAPSLWRLADDAVEIAYTTPSRAECALAMTEVAA